MRVVHIVSSLQIGGAERLAIDLARAQLVSGLDVAIISLASRGHARRALRSPNTLDENEQPLAAEARRLGIRVFSIGRFRSRLARLAVFGSLLVGRDHALHIHNPWALRAVLPILPTIRGRVIYTRHGASPYNSRSWRTVHRLARPFVDRVTFVTDEAKRSFEAVHGASPRRHLVVENGVSVAPVPPRRPAPSAIRIGTVGRLVELKGHHHVLEAVRALDPVSRSRLEVHVFGDGPERDRLTERARAHLPNVPVRFHGTVIDREQIYAGIDVLAVGSRTEGQSMAIMEAMARGIPAIATNVGGNPQLVRDGETGLLVPPEDPAAIRGALAALLADPELVSRLGRASHALIAARHSIQSVAEKYLALYSP